MKRPRLAGKLFRVARRVDDIEALASGNPERIARRAKNKLVGRLIARAGFFRRLWR